MTDLVHLHVHSMGSLLDGLPTPEEIVMRAKELGQDAIAITDHGTMGTALLFSKAAAAAGVKPLIGIEAYLAQKDLTSRDPDDKIYHIGLIARNETGYKNLCKLSNIAWNKGFYKKPKIDMQTLKEFGDGLIVLSGCMDGVVSSALRQYDVGRAMDITKELVERFGDDFYIEIQPWNEPELNEALIEIADTVGISIVATADAHYASMEDGVAEEVALLINQTSEMSKREKDGADYKFAESRKIPLLIDRINYLYPDRKLRFDKIQNYLMRYGELKQRFLAVGIDRDDIYENPITLADKVETWEMLSDQDRLPQFDSHIDSFQYLSELARDKLAYFGLDGQSEYVERIEEELRVIGKLNFSNYMLIIWDMCNWARANNIMTGPGRGSVGGSLLAFVLGITRIDPIKHNLLFWRFLSLDESGGAGRIDPPDIDTDIEDRRRDEVKKYLVSRWNHVMSITTFSKFSSKGMIRDIARVFAVPISQVNEVSKSFDDMEGFLNNEATRKFRTDYPEIEHIASKLEGRWRFTALHPAGMVVADRPLEEILPIESRTDKIKGERINCTAFDMDGVKDLNLIKFDVLGIRALSVIHDCLDQIKILRGEDIDLDSIPLDDADVLYEFSRGHTVGIFQVETEAYKRLIKQMGIETFEHLTASNALVRPGPLATVTPAFIARKQGRQAVAYDNEKMREITGDTFGLIIYQEQLMMALVEFGGFTQAEADKARSIIGKKRDESAFKPFEEKWMENASISLGKTRAKKYWKDFLKHAAYSFNLSHACAYSMLSYQTMWLKYYYPLEFIYGLMANEPDKKQITTFILEARRLGIKVLPPDINDSDMAFSLVGDAVRFGLHNINGIGKQAIGEILAKRPFSSYEDFEERTVKRLCNSKVRGVLVKSGAMNSLKDPGFDLAQYSYELLGFPQDLDEQIDLGIEIGNMEDFKTEELLCVKAIVKSVERKPQYIKVELQDLTDSMTFFTTSDTEIIEGKVVIALVCGQDLAGFSYIDSLKERVEIGGKFSRFENFMFGDVFGEEISLYDEGIGGFGDDKVLVLPIYKREFRIRSGKMQGQLMASLIVTDGVESKRMILFPREYGNVIVRLKTFEPIVIKPALTRDGTLTVEENGIRFAKDLMEVKNNGQQ